MDDIDFLGIDDVLEIHVDQIERYGGSAEVRDVGLLQSAVAMPQATFGGSYLHEDLYVMAAAYLFHIVQNHPFVDGNKRTGAAAADVFLALNGMSLDVPEDGLEALVMRVVAGDADKAEIASFLREHSSQL